jgi:hypothetical protein
MPPSKQQGLNLSLFSGNGTGRNSLPAHSTVVGSDSLLGQQRNTWRSLRHTPSFLFFVMIGLSVLSTANSFEEPIVFYVLGDIPYNAEEAALLDSHMLNIPDDADFVVHVGDIRSARQKDDCTAEEFNNVSLRCVRMERQSILIGRDAV